MSRILVTGTSSGFGRAIAAHFLDRGWEVVATMRNPSTQGLPVSDKLRLLPLDVTDADSIAAAIARAGPLDALVNNAGVGMLNVLEGARLVLPGSAPETSFGRNAVARMGMDVPEAYGPFVQAYFQSLQTATQKTQARDVAEAVWRAVTDETAPMKLPAGADA
jgi:NAD(P)-dependent dehydrogenase (short-subunit alcohol dehydrogenase family)